MKIEAEADVTEYHCGRLQRKLEKGVLNSIKVFTVRERNSLHLFNKFVCALELV